MTLRDLAWGVALWPLTAATAWFVFVEDWDMAASSVLGLLLGTALAYGLCGALVWLPAGAWLSGKLRRVPLIGRAIVFAVFGFVLGTVVVGTLALISGNATWPNSLGVVLQHAMVAAAASLLGWMLATVNASRRRRTSAEQVISTDRSRNP
ncbi:hypothetical protein [Agromyces sp. Marseille-Q5079]|uniref:hypothetical protein n=1 Tax=Agromyces sp. Marseille-Q5079 TaxID=3439059 RepID=UPI003D9CB0CD